MHDQPLRPFSWHLDGGSGGARLNRQEFADFVLASRPSPSTPYTSIAVTPGALGTFLKLQRLTRVFAGGIEKAVPLACCSASPANWMPIRQTIQDYVVFAQTGKASLPVLLDLTHIELHRFPPLGVPRPCSIKLCSDEQHPLSGRRQCPRRFQSISVVRLRSFLSPAPIRHGPWLPHRA